MIDIKDRNNKLIILDKDNIRKDNGDNIIEFDYKEYIKYNVSINKVINIIGKIYNLNDIQIAIYNYLIWYSYMVSYNMEDSTIFIINKEFINKATEQLKCSISTFNRGINVLCINKILRNILDTKNNITNKYTFNKGFDLSNRINDNITNIIINIK